MVVDIIDLSLSDENKIKFIYSLCPDYLCIHLSTDVVKKGGSLLEFSRQSSFVSSRRLPLMVAGGIHSLNLPEILKSIRPAIVVAGDVYKRQIGDVAPRGVCGTGLIDALACLIKGGSIASNGRLQKDNHLLSSRIQAEGKSPYFVLSHEDVYKRQP